MRYTFLLPAYKAEYLRDSIKSILSQTHKDFRIIVSNDNSPENIENIVNEFKDNRITYRKNKENIGGKKLVDHWNTLVNMCESDYLIMASDDDIYNKYFLERVDYLSYKYPQVNIIRCRAQRINSQGEVISKEDIFDEFQTELEVIHSIFCGNYIGCIGNYVFNTQALKKNNGFVFFPYAWFSDLLTAAKLSKGGQANSFETLFSFRLSESNISNTNRNKIIDRNKLEATLAFDSELSNYLSKLEFPHNSLYDHMYNETTSAFKHRVYSQCGDYSWSLPFYYWFKSIYKRLRGNAFFSLKSFLKYFFISISNRAFK